MSPAGRSVSRTPTRVQKGINAHTNRRKRSLRQTFWLLLRVQDASRKYHVGNAVGGRGREPRREGAKSAGGKDKMKGRRAMLMIEAGDAARRSEWNSGRNGRNGRYRRVQTRRWGGGGLPWDGGNVLTDGRMWSS